MTKRGRQQSPPASRKRPNLTNSMRVSTSPTGSLSDDTGLIPLQSPSQSPPRTSTASEVCTTSTQNGIISTSIHRSIGPQSSQTQSFTTKSGMANQKRHPIQSVLHPYAYMPTDGLPSPRSMHESSPVDTIVTSFEAHSVKSPEFLLSAQNTPTNAFPTFPGSDIVVRTNLTTPPKQWQLHSAVLTRHSTWFARSIQAQRATIETTECYVYVIEEVDGQIRLTHQATGGDQSTIIKAHDDSTMNSINIKVEHNVEAAAREVIIDAYNNIFAAFYSISPHITPTNINTATTQAEELVKTAQHLGCIYLISSHVGNALLQYRQSIYKAILHDPPRYLLLALALENDFIYTESLIHMIGAYPCWPWPTSHTTLPPEIRRLVANKSRELELEVLDVERELLLLTITTDKHEPFRCDTTAQFDTWFVVQLFRDTLTNVLRQHDASKPSLRRGSLFRKIRAGGSRYMVYEEVRRMVQRVMPSAADTLEEDLRILKEYASKIVRDLARNELSLDVEEHKVGWLTCVKVENGDIPWRAGGEKDG